MNKIALVLAVIVLFCGYHVNAQLFSGSNLLLGGLALGALGGAFNGIGGGRGWGGGGGGFGGWGGGGFGGPVIGGGFGGPVVNSGYPYGTIGKLIFWFYRWHSFKS
jgi:hypothetical protein